MENIGFIGVHVGAGKYSEKSVAQYEKLCRTACERGNEVLNVGKSSLEAVTVATAILEDSELTNAGYGSNLTMDGFVECDASVMNGATMHFGAVGAVTRVKNPVCLAEKICNNQSSKLSLGRIPPCLLVGNGADNAAQQYSDIVTLVPDSLISPNALKLHQKYKNQLNHVHHAEFDYLNFSRLDTVGAVAIDKAGMTAASCSSGGILLKQPGRIGQAAMYGCGCWADSGEPMGDVRVAVSTSGCGEHLIRTMLAKETANRMKKETDVTCFSLSETLKQSFLAYQAPALEDYPSTEQIIFSLDSRELQNVEEKLCGVLVLRRDHRDCEFLWAHSTPSLCIGYINTTECKAKSRLSSLDSISRAGKSLVVEGVSVFPANR